VTLTPQSQFESLQPDYQKLLQAFDLFTTTSRSLQSSYQELRGQVQRLSSELESANAELKKSLEENERIQNYLRSILENLGNGVLVVDWEGQVTVCNPAAIRMLDLPPGISKVPESLYNLPLPEQLSRFIQESLSPSELPADDIELQFNRVEGKPGFLAISRSPVIDPKGNWVGVTIVLKDVTRLKELEQQTQRAQRLQAMGEMAVQLAHEIRNPLGSIELFASLLRSELQANDDAKRWAEQISTGIQFLNTIVSNMLSFARSSRPQIREFDLGDLIENTLSFIEPVFAQRKIQLERADSPEPVRQRGDPDMLRQMLMNLFMNALQAMPEQGKLMVRTRQSSPGWVEIEVEDTGIGIAPENLKRIFDPFFTTSEYGTGLGLSLVHQIVEKHNGKVTARSTLGKGTCFTMILPLDGRAKC
jgi:two-component system sensor histidine kinase FlrB